MDNKVVRKTKQNKAVCRVDSDSGISNGSADMPVTNKRAQPVLPPGMPSQTFCITISSNKKREVNVKKLKIVPALPPQSQTLSLNKIDSSESEQDSEFSENHAFTNKMNWSDVSSESADDEPCGMLHKIDRNNKLVQDDAGQVNRLEYEEISPIWSPIHSDDESLFDSLGDENVKPLESFWEHEEIDILVVTAKCHCFYSAKLQMEKLTEKFLLEYPSMALDVQNTWKHTAVKIPDVDLITLHPNENFDYCLPALQDVNCKNNTAPKRPSTTYPAEPGNQKKPCFESKAPALASLPVGISFHSQSSQQIESTAKPTKMKILSTISLRKTQQTAKVQPANAQLQCLAVTTNALVPVRKESPRAVVLPLKKQPESIFGLANRLCRYFGSCYKQHCRFLHKLKSSDLVGTVMGQNLFWRHIQLKPPNLNLMRKLFDEFPPALVKTNNAELLHILIGDMITLNDIQWNRTTILKKIIDALMQIRAGGELPTFENIVESILVNNRCYDGNFTIQKRILCDNIVCITADQEGFLKHWSVLEKIFTAMLAAKDYNVDPSVVAKIVKACLADEVQPEFVRTVFEKLIHTHLVVTEKLSPADLVKITHKLNQSSAPKVCASPPKTSVLVEELKDLFPQGDPDRLSEFLRTNCDPRNWELVVMTIISLWDLQDKDNLTSLTMVKESILICLIDGVDENLRMLLMTLVFNLVIFQKYRRLSSQRTWDISAALLSAFKDNIELFHSVPVYIKNYSGSKAWYVFAYLVHGKKFLIALRCLQTSADAFPLKGNAVYRKFCLQIKNLFRGLSEHSHYEECKDLLLLLTNNDFDIDDLNRVDMNNYYRRFVNHMTNAWMKNERDILGYAKESIYQFFTCLTLKEQRNVLILLYLKWEEIDFRRFIDMVDSVNEFYDQSANESIMFNANLSIVEIQFVTHVFFHKMFARNQAPCAVSVFHSEPGNVFTPPYVSTLDFWDSEPCMRLRIAYALKNFTLQSITKFDGVIAVDKVSLILDRIKHQMPTS